MAAYRWTGQQQGHLLHRVRLLPRVSRSCWLIRVVPVKLPDHACWAPISTHAPRLTTEDREVWPPLVKRSAVCTVPLPRPVRGISRDPFQCKITIASSVVVDVTVILRSICFVCSDNEEFPFPTVCTLLFQRTLLLVVPPLPMA
jgi:hypothetical protein